MDDPSEEQIHLDGVRIARLSAVRRAEHRSRSYCLIGTGGCAGGAAELIYQAIHSRPLIMALCFLAAILLLWLAVIFLKRARAHGVEARKTLLHPSTSPPDFSNLGDGSQLARNLEKLMDEDRTND